MSWENTTFIVFLLFATIKSSINEQYPSPNCGDMVEIFDLEIRRLTSTLYAVILPAENRSSFEFPKKITVLCSDTGNILNYQCFFSYSRYQNSHIIIYLQYENVLTSENSLTISTFKEKNKPTRTISTSFGRIEDQIQALKPTKWIKSMSCLTVEIHRSEVFGSVQMCDAICFIVEMKKRVSYLSSKCNVYGDNTAFEFSSFKNQIDFEDHYIICAFVGEVFMFSSAYKPTENGNFQIYSLYSAPSPVNPVPEGKPASEETPVPEEKLIPEEARVPEEIPMPVLNYYKMKTPKYRYLNSQ